MPATVSARRILRSAVVGGKGEGEGAEEKQKPAPSKSSTTASKGKRTARLTAVASAPTPSYSPHGKTASKSSQLSRSRSRTQTAANKASADVEKEQKEYMLGEYEGSLISNMSYNEVRSALKSLGVPCKGTKIDMAGVLSEIMGKKHKEREEAFLNDGSDDNYSQNKSKAEGSKLNPASRITGIAVTTSSSSRQRREKDSVAQISVEAEVLTSSEISSLPNKSLRSNTVPNNSRSDSNTLVESAARNKEKEEEDTDGSEDASMEYERGSEGGEKGVVDLVSSGEDDDDDDDDDDEEEEEEEEEKEEDKLSAVEIPSSWPSFGAAMSQAHRQSAIPTHSNVTQYQFPVMNNNQPVQTSSIKTATFAAPSASPASSSLKTVTATAAACSFNPPPQQGQQQQLKKLPNLNGTDHPNYSEELLQYLNQRFMDAVRGGPALSDFEHKMMSDLLKASKDKQGQSSDDGDDCCSDSLLDNSVADAAEPAIISKRFTQGVGLFGAQPSLHQGAPSLWGSGAGAAARRVKWQSSEQQLGTLSMKRDSSSFTMPTTPVLQSNKRRLIENKFGVGVAAPVEPPLGMATTYGDNNYIKNRNSMTVYTPGVKQNVARGQGKGGLMTLGLQPTPGRQELKRDLLVSSLQRRQTFGGLPKTPGHFGGGIPSSAVSGNVAKCIMQTLVDMASPLEEQRKKPSAAQWGPVNKMLETRSSIFMQPQRSDYYTTSAPTSGGKHTATVLGGRGGGEAGGGGGAYEATREQGVGKGMSSKSENDFSDAPLQSKRIASVTIPAYKELEDNTQKQKQTKQRKEIDTFAGSGEFSFSVPESILMADAGLKRNVPGQEQLEPSTMEYTFSRPSNAEALCSRYPVTDIRRAAPLKEVAAVSVPVNKPTEFKNDTKPAMSIWAMASMKWKCEVCLGQNDQEMSACVVCDAPKGTAAVMGGFDSAEAMGTGQGSASDKPFTGFASATKIPTVVAAGTSNFTFAAPTVTTLSESIKGKELFTPAVTSGPGAVGKRKEEEEKNGGPVSKKKASFLLQENTTTTSVGTGFSFPAALSSAVAPAANTLPKNIAATGFKFGAEAPQVFTTGATPTLPSTAGYSFKALPSSGASAASLSADISTGKNDGQTRASKDEKGMGNGTTTLLSDLHKPITNVTPSFESQPTSSTTTATTTSKTESNIDSTTLLLPSSTTSFQAPTSNSFGQPTTIPAAALITATSAAKKSEEKKSEEQPSEAMKSKHSLDPFSAVGSLGSTPFKVDSSSSFTFGTSAFGAASKVVASSSSAPAFATSSVVVKKEDGAVSGTEETDAYSATATAATLSNPFSAAVNPFGGGPVTSSSSSASSSSSSSSSKSAVNPFGAAPSSTTGSTVNPFGAAPTGASSGVGIFGLAPTAAVSPFAPSSAKEIKTTEASSSPQQVHRDSCTQAADSPMSMMDTGYNSETGTNANQNPSPSTSLPPSAFAFGSPAAINSTTVFSTFGAPTISSAPSTAGSSSMTNFFNSTTATVTVATLSNPFSVAVNPFGGGPVTSSSSSASSSSSSSSSKSAVNPFGAAPSSTTGSTVNPFGAAPTGASSGVGIFGVAPTPVFGSSSSGAGPSFSFNGSSSSNVGGVANLFGGGGGGGGGGGSTFMAAGNPSVGGAANPFGGVGSTPTNGAGGAAGGFSVGASTGRKPRLRARRP